jgi:hypothetical protein
MSQKRILHILAVCLVASIAVLSAFGQDYKPLLGKWNMTSETSGDPVQWTLILKDSSGQLAGFLTTDANEQPIKGLTYADGVLKFKAPYQGADYDIELKATSEKLDGKWSGGGDSGKTSGTKVNPS